MTRGAGMIINNVGNVVTFLQFFWTAWEVLWCFVQDGKERCLANQAREGRKRWKVIHINVHIITIIILFFYIQFEDSISILSHMLIPSSLVPLIHPSPHKSTEPPPPPLLPPPTPPPAHPHATHHPHTHPHPNRHIPGSTRFLRDLFAPRNLLSLAWWQGRLG